jgi:hypothetical protein
MKYSFPNQNIFQEGNGFSIQDFGVGLSPEQRNKLMREVTASQQGTSKKLHKKILAFNKEDKDFHVIKLT